MRRKVTNGLRAAVAAVLLSLPTACHVHVHRIGAGPNGIGSDSMRQFYVLFGFFQLNEVDAQRMVHGVASFEIRSEFTFTDFLITTLLLPFTVTTRTVTASW